MTRTPTFHDVTAAAGRLHGEAVRTPLLRSDRLDAITGGRVFVKAEPLQKTGSFKYRGAYNRIVQLSPEERARGVVAFSSGNHAQGVAAAAARLGVKATIVMPTDSPTLKLDNTRAFGAEVVLYDRYTEDRVAIGRRLAEDQGATLVPSFDDPDIIAGQGTVGLETIEQGREAGAELDLFLCCCGGGGLIGGCALAFAALSPATRLHPVEPAGFDDTARSLAAGQILSNDPAARSICDALLTEHPGDLTFALNQTRLSEGLVVSDDEALTAVAFALLRLKLVVEPGGAVALAAVLFGKLDLKGKTVAVVCSGGNADPQMLARALEARAEAALAL